MTYELWDTSVGTLLAHDVSDVTMASLVRSLVRHHGKSQSDTLNLSIDDADGTHLQSLFGAELIAWSDRVLDGSNGREGQKIGSSAPVDSTQSSR
jgi:hypothetical protein